MKTIIKVMTHHCENCGAPLKYKKSRCEYCESDFRLIKIHKPHVKNIWKHTEGTESAKSNIVTTSELKFKLSDKKLITLKLYGETKAGKPAIMQFDGVIHLLKGRDAIEKRDFHYYTPKSVIPDGIKLINSDFESPKILLDTIELDLKQIPRFEKLEIYIGNYSGPGRDSYDIKDFKTLFMEVAIESEVIATINIKKAPGVYKHNHSAQVLKVISKDASHFELTNTVNSRKHVYK